jgi:hypothetical protein
MIDEELIGRMRARVQQLRKMIGMAHNPELVAILTRVAEDGEADIARLEAELAGKPIGKPGQEAE